MTNRAAPAGAGARSAAIAAVVPALDEEDTIAACLAPLLAEGARVVVADGGSRDRTMAIARQAGAQAIPAPRGRAAQMNAGAARAGECDAIVFVHADTRVPAGWRAGIESALAAGACWGRFDVVLDSPRPMLRAVAAAMNLRSRVTGIATGDQAIFVRADAWRACGGYPPIALMEDIELSRRLGRVAGRPACLRVQALASARRWERNGVLRTIALMWLLRAMHFVRVPASTLHRIYYGRDA